MILLSKNVSVIYLCVTQMADICRFTLWNKIKRPNFLYNYAKMDDFLNKKSHLITNFKRKEAGRRGIVVRK